MMKLGTTFENHPVAWQNWKIVEKKANLMQQQRNSNFRNLKKSEGKLLQEHLVQSENQSKNIDTPFLLHFGTSQMF